MTLVRRGGANFTLRNHHNWLGLKDLVTGLSGFFFQPSMGQAVGHRFQLAIPDVMQAALNAIRIYWSVSTPPFVAELKFTVAEFKFGPQEQSPPSNL